MARKKAALFEATPTSQVAEQKEVTPVVKTATEGEVVVPESANDIDKDKQISDLLQQVSELEAKVADYIAELEPLRDIKAKLDEANAKLKEATDNVVAKTAELEKLQADCDQYLLKISELTFENAKLAAAQKNCRPNVQRNSAANIFNGRSASGFSAPVQYSRSPNGYGTWN